MIVSHRLSGANRDTGLTLVELLVVLSILAVVSTAALRSVVGSFEEQNYDANVSQLEQIELAVLGNDNQAGFLGDIGRLPVAAGDSSTTNFSQLAELWDQGSLSDYAIQAPAGDAEVRLGTGWRGPYLSLGINRDDLSDGFANPFVLYQTDGSISDNGDTIAVVQSFGADGTANGTSYEEDLEVIFQVNAGVLPAPDDVAANRWTQDLNVTIVSDPAPIERETAGTAESVVVRIYGADGNGDLVTLEQVEEEIPVGGTPDISVVMDGDDDATVDTGPGLPLGAKVIRAYRVENTDIPAKQADILADDKSISPATHVILDRFTSTITLTLYPAP